MSGPCAFGVHEACVGPYGQFEAMASDHLSAEEWKETLHCRNRRCHHHQVLRNEFLVGEIDAGASPWWSFCRSFLGSLHEHICRDAFQCEYGDGVPNWKNQRISFHNQCVDIGGASRLYEYGYEPSKHFSE
jgi:hypothetical protein